MFLRPALGLLVKPVDIFVQLAAVYAPHAAASDLDRRELAGTDQRIDLWDADGQIFRDLVQSEETRFDLGHRPTIAVDGDGYLNLRTFALVWRPLRGGGSGWL